MSKLHETLAQCHPKIERGRVWCRECGRTQKVSPAHCLEHGWPKCCGYTMTIGAPKETTCPGEPAHANGLTHP